MAEKKKLSTLTTPAGIAVYPWLVEPDTKFNADGEYRTKLRLPKSEVGEIINKIDAAAAEALATAKEDICKKAKNKKEEKEKLAKCVPADLPYKDVIDDDGNETGEVELNFKMKAKVKTKSGKIFEQRPQLFDAKGKPIKEDITIYSGSTIKVAFQIVPFFTPLVGAGVSLRLRAVQIIDLVSGGGNAESYGFGEEEGYEHGVGGDENAIDCSEDEDAIDCSEDKDF